MTRGTLKALIIFNNASHLGKFREKANEGYWRTYVGDGVLGEFAKNESSSETTIGRPLQEDEANVEAVYPSTEDTSSMSTVTKAPKEERKRKKREQEEETEVTGEVSLRKKKVNIVALHYLGILTVVIRRKASRRMRARNQKSRCRLQGRYLPRSRTSQRS
jgi:hypothetical protein